MKLFLRQSEREIDNVQESIQSKFSAHFTANPQDVESKSFFTPGKKMQYNSYGVYGLLKRDIHDILAVSLKENTGTLDTFKANAEAIAQQITDTLVDIPLRRYGTKDYATTAQVARSAVVSVPATLGTSLLLEPARVGIYGRFEKWRKIGVPDYHAPENKKAIREAVKDAFSEHALPPKEKAIHWVRKSIRDEFRAHYAENPQQITDATGLLSSGKEIQPKEYEIQGRAWGRIYKEMEALLKKNPEIAQIINDDPQVRARIAKQVVQGEVNGEKQREGLVDVGLRRFGGRDKYTLRQRLVGGRVPVLSHLALAVDGKMEKWNDTAVPDYIDNKDKFKEIIQDAIIDNTLGIDSPTRIARDTTRTVDAIKVAVQQDYATRVGENATIDGRALKRVETEIRGFVGRNFEQSKGLVRNLQERQAVAIQLVDALVEVPQKTHTWLGRSKTAPDYANHKEEYVQAVKDVLIDRYLPEQHPERVARDTERALRDLQKTVQETFKARPREEGAVLNSKGEAVVPSSYEIQGRALDRVYEDSKAFLSKYPDKLQAFIAAKDRIVEQLVTDIDALPRKLLDATDLYAASERAKGSGLLQSESTVAVPAYEKNKAAFKDAINNALLDNVLEVGHETRVARDTERALQALQKTVQAQFKEHPRGEAVPLVNSKGEEVTPTSYDIQGRALERIYTDSKEFLNRHPDQLDRFIENKDAIAANILAEVSGLPLKLADATDLYATTERLKGNGLLQSESTVAVPAYKENKAAFQGAISSALTGLLAPGHEERVKSERDTAIRALQTTVKAEFPAEMSAEVKAQNLEFIGRESRDFLIRNPEALENFRAKKETIAAQLQDGYTVENFRDALIDHSLPLNATVRLQRDGERNIAALQKAIQDKVAAQYGDDAVELKDSKGRAVEATSVKIVGRALERLHDDTKAFLIEHKIDLDAFKGKEDAIATQVAEAITTLPVKKPTLSDHSKVALVGSFVDRVKGVSPQGVAADKESAVIDYDANKGAFKEALKDALIDHLLPEGHKTRVARDEARLAEPASREMRSAEGQTFVGRFFAAASQATVRTPPR